MKVKQKVKKTGFFYKLPIFMKTNNKPNRTKPNRKTTKKVVSDIYDE